MAYEDKEERPAKGGSNTDETILKDALERFKESEDGADFNRESAKEDMRFGRLGEQWPELIKSTRQSEGRPCLTINKLPSFVRQVVNDARQNKPSIQVHPVDNGADVDTAEVINGLIRSIERRSRADVAYDTGIDHSASAGFGFFRIVTDYVHQFSFEQEARIERISNPMAVHWDVSTTEFDASDWEYAFVSEMLDDDEFESKYPDAEKVPFEGDDTRTLQWRDQDKTRVAEYWAREEVKKKLLLFSNGETALEDDVTDEKKAWNATHKIKVIKDRETTVYKVIRRIISGAQVLESEVWPGQLIPICPVWGEEITDFVDGRRHLRSMIYDAKPAQEMFNYWRSATTELVALAPKAPYVGPKGFVPKGDKKWQTANSRSHPYLEYEGNVKPERQPFAGVPAGALQESLNASDDMKAIIGIYDSSLGARSNETSGRAIMARQREADVSNFHFVDNLSRAIQYAGRCLVEIIPSVYSQRETIRILGDDMKEKVVKLAGEGRSPKDRETLYDLSVGKYDVTVKAGPSFATQREETREALIEIMSRVPEAGKYIGDIVMEHMDFQGADKVAKRLKTILPPEVQQMETEGEEGETDIPPEAQQKILLMGQQIQQMQVQLQEAQQQAAEGQNEQGKLMIEKGKQDVDRMKLELERMKLQVEGEKVGMEQDGQQVQFNLEAGISGMAQSIQTLTQMIGQTLNGNQDQLNQVAESIRQSAEINALPKRVIRDGTGRVTGVEPDMTITEENI